MNRISTGIMLAKRKLPRCSRNRWKIELVAGGSRVAVGQTDTGRYLRVIYVPDPEPETAFVVTAYDLGPKALKALRRRRRRKS
jgi:hypothetical protein